MTEPESEPTRQRAEELLRRHELGGEHGVTAELGRLCRVVTKALTLLGATGR